MTVYEAFVDIMDKEWCNIKVAFAEPWEMPWKVPAGIRDDYEVLFLEKGKGRFYVGNREYAVSEGDIVCLHSLEGNSFVADEAPIRFVFLTFKIEPVKEPDKIKELNQLLSEAHFPIKFIDVQKVREMMYGIHKEMSLKSSQYMVRIKFLLGKLFIQLQEQYKENRGLENIKFNANNQSHELINKLIIYLQEHYNKKISLEYLGRLANLHPRYLCTLFRQVSGKTISELLREIRIEKAKRLLLYTSLSITDIALETGFCNSQYFSRTFSKYEGIDPRTFRKTKGLSSEYYAQFL